MALNIVVLDGFTTNPGDLSFDNLSRFGNVTVYDRTTPAELIERAARADVIVSNKIVFDMGNLPRLPRLKLITVLGTGYNTIDTTAASACGVTVCNVPGYSTPSVAQHVFALLLELCSHVGAYNTSVQAGDWQRSIDYSYCVAPITELSGLTLGIVGLGGIGSKVAEIGAAFGMNVLYNSRTRKPQLENDNLHWAELPELLAKSDVVTLHCPLFPSTKHLINAQSIQGMKDGAILINTSRGPVIDEKAVAEALHSGKLGGAGIDVLDNEPPRDGSPLIGAPNCILTPHVAWAPKAARIRLIAATEKNIEMFLAGTPQNKVN